MSFDALFPIPLERSEEEIIAALYLLGREPSQVFFADSLFSKATEVLRLLSDLPEPWAKELAVNILERAQSSAIPDK